MQGAVTFNGRGQVHAQFLPHYAATNSLVDAAPDPSKASISLIYDPLLRMVESRNPDGTVARTTYLPLGQEQWDEENTNPTSAHTNTPLTHITDAHGNIKTQVFDALGRKLSADDPDRGLTTNRCDDAGNLLETTDAKGQIIRYGYDGANRLNPYPGSMPS